MYYGPAKGMVSYFTALGFSYPPLVNPCDYYGKYFPQFGYKKCLIF